MFGEDLGQLSPVTGVGTEEELGRSTNLLDEVAHPAGFRGDLGEQKCLRLQMYQVAEFELRLPTTEQEILCVEVQK